MKVRLTGHSGAVTALAFSRDGSVLLSGSRDTDIIVWDVVAESGRFRSVRACTHTCPTVASVRCSCFNARLRGHKDEVTALRLIERTNCVVSASKDTLVKVRNAPVPPHKAAPPCHGSVMC